MHVCRGGLREAAEEILHQLRLQIADAMRTELPPADAMRASAEVDGRGSQSFIHGHQEIAGPEDAAFRAQGFYDRLAERYAEVLDRVVLVDVKVAFGHDLQVHGSMTRDQVQHVVEKTNARRDIGAAPPIQIQANLDIRLLRRTMNTGASHFQYFSSSFVLCRMMRAPLRRSCAARTR